MDTSPVAAALNGLYRSIQPDLERVEEELRLVVPSANPLLREIGDYLFQLGGKRVRPALLLLSNRLFAPPIRTRSSGRPWSRSCTPPV